MDFARSIKRLAVIVLLAIVVILVSKSLLTRTVKNLNAEAGKQQQIKASPTPAAVPESAVTAVADGAEVDAGTLAVAAESAPAVAESGVAGLQ